MGIKFLSLLLDLIIRDITVRLWREKKNEVRAKRGLKCPNLFLGYRQREKVENVKWVWNLLFVFPQQNRKKLAKYGENPKVWNNKHVSYHKKKTYLRGRILMMFHPFSPLIITKWFVKLPCAKFFKIRVGFYYIFIVCLMLLGCFICITSYELYTISN